MPAFLHATVDQLKESMSRMCTVIGWRDLVVLCDYAQDRQGAMRSGRRQTRAFEAETVVKRAVVDIPVAQQGAASRKKRYKSGADHRNEKGMGYLTGNSGSRGAPESRDVLPPVPPRTTIFRTAGRMETV